MLHAGIPEPYPQVFVYDELVYAIQKKGREAAPVLKDLFLKGVKFWPCWVIAALMSGCFRSVPVETLPEINIPVEILVTEEAEFTYFEQTVEEQIIKTVVMGEESDNLNVKYMVEGRFTQRDQPEMLSLVEGNLGKQGLDAYWVVLQKDDHNWRIAAVSKAVSGQFLSEREDSSVPYWMPPQILDFDHDGIQEMFIPLHDEQGGWKWDSIHVYRFDGIAWGKLDWSMIVFQDNTDVPASDLALPYRYTYQVKWALEDLDQDQVDEILMNETVIYYGLNDVAQTFDINNVLGKQEHERVYQWVEGIFEPDQNDPSFDDLDFTASSAFFPWWNSEELPDMVFAEYPDGGQPSIHFTVRGEHDRIVALEQWKGTGSLQVVGSHVYFPGGTADQQGSKEIPSPGLPGALSVLASPDETKLAWLFVSELEDQGGDQNKGVNATLLVSDLTGDLPRVVWTMEQKDAAIYYSLLGWSADGRQIYLGQTADPEAASWNNHSGILAMDAGTGAVTRIGQQVNIVETALSPDEAWLVQVERLGQADSFGLSLVFESRVTQAVWKINALENALRVGNFSFSPDGTDVVWQEWTRTDSEDRIVIRGLALTDGMPRKIHEAVLEPAKTPRKMGVVRGWVDETRFVLVDDAGKGGSYLINADKGGKEPLSPYSFLAVQK